MNLKLIFLILLIAGGSIFLLTMHQEPTAQPLTAYQQGYNAGLNWSENGTDPGYWANYCPLNQTSQFNESFATGFSDAIESN